MKYFNALAICGALFLVGCGDDEAEQARRDAEDTPPAEEVQVMTAVQLAAKMKPAVTQVAAYVHQPLPVPDAVRNEIISTLNQNKSRNATEPNGAEANGMIEKELNGLLKVAETNKAWYGILLVCDSVEVFDPGKASLVRYRDKANLQIRQPVCALKGVTKVPDGEEIAHIQVYLPATGVTERWDARVGEENYTLRLEEIYQRGRGVRLRYLEINEVRELLLNQGGLNPESYVR
jgi:hypothetical protein